MKSFINIVIVLVLLCAQVQAGPIVVPDISKQGYEFVLEIAGYVIQRRINSLEGKTITKEFPGGCKVEIVFDSVIGEACKKCSPNLRLIGYLKVKRQSDSQSYVNNATISIYAELTVSQPPNAQLKITPTANTLQMTADAPDACLVEQFVQQMAAEITKTLTLSVPLDGMDVFASARPANSPPFAAAAYELGLQWVLQIYGPIYPQKLPAPEVFLIGDAFTIALSKDSIQRLAESEFVAGRFPTRMSDKGLVDPDGSIKITAVAVDLGRDVLVLKWRGFSADNEEAVVQWRMGFVTTTDGLSLTVRQIFVNGEPMPTPEGLKIVNPMDELIRNIAIGSDQTPALLGPLGRVKLTTGVISPIGMIVAGRA